MGQLLEQDIVRWDGPLLKVKQYARETSELSANKLCQLTSNSVSVLILKPMQMTLALAFLNISESMAGMNYSHWKTKCGWKKRKREMIIRLLQTIVVSRSSKKAHDPSHTKKACKSTLDGY